MLSKIKEEFGKKQVEFKDNMILSKIQPHTAPVADLKECCSGTITAQYYFAARYFDEIDDDLAVGIVSELKKLQVTDEDQFGCMRWYREEEYISDTNGAFFVLLPLALTYKFCENKMTESEKTDIRELLKNALVWFSHAAEGSLHYCNKIMSDGAMLALIYDITGEGKEICEFFWRKWHNYADNNGWGWGENSSDCYSTIMLNALNAVVISTDGELREKALKRREKLLDYILYHEGKEFIPSIRTYNFAAKANYGGSVYSILRGTDSYEAVSVNVSDTLAAILIYESGLKMSEMDSSNVRKEQLFGDSYAYTWKGENVRLGSVTHFPVMPCSYQNGIMGPGGRWVTYGLGWQSMPVGAMVDDKVGFLRIRTKVGESEHSHPAVTKHDAFLFNRLFEDGNITVFSTISAQENNIAVVSRYANKLTNTASFICDEWCIDADLREIKTEDKTWYVAADKIALLPLDGIAAEASSRAPMKTYISESGAFRTITTEFYSGEEKLISAPRVESAWVIVALENVGDAEEYLGKLQISDEILPNIEITLANYYKKRKISCSDGKSSAELLIDPTNQYDF